MARTCKCTKIITSLCTSVRRSVSRLVGLSVHHILLFSGFYLFTLLLLPKCSTDLKYGPCPAAHNWVSRVSGLVVFTRSFLQVISQSFFGNIWWNFSWNLLIWRIFYSWTKSWLKWPWNSVFLCKNGKMGFFWSELFFEPFFPMKLFTEGHKILHDGNCIELEVPFQIL